MNKECSGAPEPIKGGTQYEEKKCIQNHRAGTVRNHAAEWRRRPYRSRF